MENKLVLKDGTEIQGGSASRSSNNELMIRVPGKDLVNLAVLFSDPNKTEEIVSYVSVYKYTYTGFTEMYSIQYFTNEDRTEIWLKPQKDAKISMTRELTVPKEYMPLEGVQEDA
jgi:hypothetical protein